MSIFIAFQIINVTLSIVGIIVWLLYYYTYKEPGAIAPITWLINLLFYNAYLVFMPHTVEATNIASVWASGLRTHAAILLIFAVIIMYPRHAKRKE